MLKKKRAKVLLIALVLLAFHVGKISKDAGVFRGIEDNQSFGVCSKIEGPVGTEDITIDHARKIAYISADDRREAFLNKDLASYENGGIWVLDLTDPKAEPRKLAIKMKVAFHPHGIALRFEEPTQSEKEAGVVQGKAIELYVVNHIDMQTHEINVFTILPDGGLKLRRRIPFPELISPNDIVVLGKDRFFVSNDHGSPRNTLMEVVEDYAGLPLSSVVYFDGEQGHIVVDGLRYTNGLALSADKKTLFVAETTGNQVSRYMKGKDIFTWHLVDTLYIPMAVDNLEWLGDTHLLTAGHPKIFEFTAHMKDANHSAPSQAFKIDVSGNRMTAESIYYDNGDMISGTSVASMYENQLLLGAVFEPFALRCIKPESK
jgi:hypothetical protein